MLRLPRVQRLPLLLRLEKVWKQSDDEIDICFDAGLGIAFSCETCSRTGMRLPTGAVGVSVKEPCCKWLITSDFR